MQRILSMSLVACLLVPFPGNPVPQAQQELPPWMAIQFAPPAAGPRQAQAEHKAISGEAGLILLMTIALKGLHGS
jgi:hypothetical protein